MKTHVNNFILPEKDLLFYIGSVGSLNQYAA